MHALSAELWHATACLSAQVQLDANPFMASYAYPTPNVAYYHQEFINSVSHLTPLFLASIRHTSEGQACSFVCKLALIESPDSACL